MNTRIVGIGQEAAGDDGVGLAVLEELRRRGVPRGVQLHVIPEPSALIDLLATTVPVILVDAVVGVPAGAVVSLAPEDLEFRPPEALSTHGMSLPAAIGLARILAGGGVMPAVRLVGIGIRRPDRFQRGLSPAVAAAVPRAVAAILDLCSTSGAGRPGATPRRGRRPEG